MRWKGDPLYPKPFAPVHNCLKLSQVLGVVSPVWAHQHVTTPSSRRRVDGVQVMIYAPRVAVEAQLHALRRAAADAYVEKDLFRDVGLALFKQAVEHAELAHCLRLHLGRARLERRRAGNQE